MKKNIHAPKIAVILAAFNGEEWLEEQVISILNQFDVEVSIFISIDKSSDRTLQLAGEFAARHEKIFMVNSTVSFGSAASNFLSTLQNIDVSIYDYVAFSDQDDIWMFEKLSKAVQSMLETNSEAYSSNLIAFDNSKCCSFFLKKKNEQKDYDYLFQGASAGCTYVLSNKAISIVQVKISGLTIEYFNTISHDWLIYATCRSYGLKWFHDNKAYIFYRQHSSNVFGALPGIKGLTFKLGLSRSGWYRKNILNIKKVLIQTENEQKIIDAISRKSFTDRLWLAFNSKKFRRGRRDVYLLAFLFIVNLI